MLVARAIATACAATARAVHWQQLFASKLRACTLAAAERASSRRQLGFRALIALGLIIAAASLAFDLLPGSRPGFHSLQIAALAGGLALALAASLARRWLGRGGGKLLPVLGKALLLTLLTLAALELALIASGYPTYYPAEVPADALQPAPWWTCGEQGCHFIAEAMAAACQAGSMQDRRCIVNQMGYHDRQEFALSEGDRTRRRILALGDSFTFGLSAAIGASYIETIEALMPAALVWNTGISSTGTNQALAAFHRVAPILQPQLTIYGFYTNDFEDNLSPVDGYFVGIDEDGDTFSVQQYHVDPWGNTTKLAGHTALYYRLHGVEAPVNEFERIAGLTRLGSLFLRSLENAGKQLGFAQRSLSQRKIALTRGYLTDLQAAAAAQDSALLIMLIPSKADLAAPGAQFNAAIALFETLAIPYFNPIDALELKRDYAGGEDVHWNSAGHQLVGRLLHACIELFYSHGDFARCERVVSP